MLQKASETLAMQFCLKVGILTVLVLTACTPAISSNQSKSKLPIKAGETWRLIIQEEIGKTSFLGDYSFLESSVYGKVNAVVITKGTISDFPFTIISGAVKVKDANLFGDVEYAELTSTDQTGLLVMQGDPSEFGYNERHTRFSDSYINITFYPDVSKGSDQKVCLINFWASENPETKFIGDLGNETGYCELQKMG